MSAFPGPGTDAERVGADDANRLPASGRGFTRSSCSARGCRNGVVQSKPHNFGCAFSFGFFLRKTKRKPTILGENPQNQVPLITGVSHPQTTKPNRGLEQTKPCSKSRSVKSLGGSCFVCPMSDILWNMRQTRLGACRFWGNPLLVGFEGKQENHHFGGSLQKRHTHLTTWNLESHVWIDP